MRLLVLGGTAFVGRAVVTEALDRGWSVTTFNRGRAAWTHPGCERIIGDRCRPGDLEALRRGRWDAVVDTWSAAPRVVRDSANVLAEHVERYVYVSSRSVYADPTPADLDESWATVDASPDADAVDYAQDKRGGEMAVEAVFGERCVLARAGLILGPYENVGRLPWWLLRMRRGGRVLAPGPPGLPVRFIDVRDLAMWMLGAAENAVSGPVNLINPLGHTTMETLLDAAVTVTGSDAHLTWVDPETILAAGIERWTELPCWLPPDDEHAGLIWGGVARALDTGLRCRPVAETVAGTWTWLQETGLQQPQAAGRPPLGLDPAKEAALLASQHDR